MNFIYDFKVIKFLWQFKKIISERIQFSENYLTFSDFASYCCYRATKPFSCTQERAKPIRIIN